MAEAASDRPGQGLPDGVNTRAPVVGSAEIEIAATREVVWEVLTGFGRWPSWNRDVKSMTMQGDVAPGSVFRWKAGPGTITSTIVRVERPSLVAWTGRTLGIAVVHVWRLDSRNGATLVRTQESFEGLVVRVFRRVLQKSLDRALTDSLGYLRTEAERRQSGET